MTLLEIPRSDVGAQERGWVFSVVAGTTFAIGAGWVGRFDLYADDDHAWTVSLYLGPLIVRLTKLDRSQYDEDTTEKEPAA